MGEKWAYNYLVNLILLILVFNYWFYYKILQIEIIHICTLNPIELEFLFHEKLLDSDRNLTNLLKIIPFNFH